MSILYVDDDPEDREIFCEAAKKVHPSATCIISGSIEEALAHVATQKIDYIILDYRMPSASDGLMCLQEIIRLNKNPSLRILVYSTFMDATEIAHCKKMGAHECVQKPGSFQDILLLIHRLTKKEI